jgi:uncharacterized protein with NRDE domain
MCLLAIMHRAHPDGPLIAAANRDEMLGRPAESITVLHALPPRILGGRDRQAGGTWLAVNEHGVVAGLTNRPGPPMPGRHSRGELPLALAGHQTAAAAVADFAGRFRPADYGAAWLLVADRRDLFSIDMTGGETPTVRRLPPGLHVLENRPPSTRSPKAAWTGEMMASLVNVRGERLVRGLQSLLRSHTVPPGAGMASDGAPRPAARQTACVHTDGYGTRSSLVAVVPAAAGARPRLWVADGPPCRTPFVDVSAMWRVARAG